MFLYALDCEYLSINPISDMKFDRGLFRTPTKQKKETQIYNSDEEDIAFLLPLLSLCIGARIGESLALKWCD